MIQGVNDEVTICLRSLACSTSAAVTWYPHWQRPTWQSPGNIPSAATLVRRNASPSKLGSDDCRWRSKTGPDRLPQHWQPPAPTF